MPIKLWFAEPSPPWMADAKCKGAETELPNLFYNDQSNSEVARAKAVCLGLDGYPACPVKAECLSYALSRPERFGVWGGTSERERRRILRRRRVIARKKEEIRIKEFASLTHCQQNGN